MTQPSLQEVFGANATQDSNFIHISKTDLAAVGLTRSANNSGESILVAINLLAKSYLTDTNLDSNPDQNISFDDGFPSLITRNNQSYRQQPVVMNLLKVDTSSTINPDDY